MKSVFDNPNENKEYLLVSIDKENVYWMIKIPGNILSNDFITLLNYILPFNVNINGFLFLGSIRPQEIESKVVSYHERLKILKEHFDQKFYVISMKGKEIGDDNQIEVNGIYCRVIDKSRLKVLNKIQTIKFHNIMDIFQENYLILSSNICPLLITNKSNFLINELFSNSLGVYYSDFNILIESLENLTDEEKNSYQNSYLKRAELAVIFEIHL